MNNRYGRFVISRYLFENDPEAVRAIMNRVLVVRCELLYYPDHFEYLALSPDFDEVPEGADAPMYEATMNKGDDSVRFVRVT